MAFHGKFVARSLATVTAAGLALAVAGCTAAPAADSDVINIAYSVDVLDDTQNAFYEAMQERVDEINAEGETQVELTVYDAQSSVDKQISDIDSALVKEPDVFIVSAVDPVGVLPAVERIAAAGIPIIDKRPSDPEPEAYDVAFYSNDEARYSAATEQWIRDYLDANPDVVLNVGLIYGAPAQTAQLVREDVVKELAAELPDRLHIVAEGYGNWLTETAQSLTQDWLQAHPELNLVVAANDIMALGASNAISAAGKSDDIMITGYDLTEEGVQRIQDGQQALDVGVNLIDGGAQIIDVALGLVDGSFTDSEFYIDPVYAITAENVEAFLAGELN